MSLASNWGNRKKIPRVTIIDVARAAGVSRSAAAYALRDDPNASKATRERVQRIAREMGYRADPMLSKLMAHLHAARTRNFLGKLAFINPDPNPDFVQVTPALNSFRMDAIERARTLGYDVEQFWLHEPGRSPERLSKMLRARGIRGVIVSDMEKWGEISGISWEHFSSITVGYGVSEPALMRVASDYYGNTLLALRRVRAAGYRRLGLLTFKQQESAALRLHAAAYLADQDEASSEDRVAVLNSGVMNPDVIRKWFDEQKPDIILTTNYPALLHFAEAGIRVPEDVAVASLSRWDDEAGIAGVRPGFDRLGTVAVNLLASQLQHDERGVPENCTTVELEGFWVDDVSMPVKSANSHVPSAAVGKRRRRISV